MNNIQGKIKIKDIAEKAGVSAGTVDRVLHNRGNVSEETKKRVKSIIAEINYTPNLYASALASKKTFVFRAVIPAYSSGEYWEMIEQGIRKGAQELIDFKVSIHVHYYDQYNQESFCRTLEEAISYKPDGMLLAPSVKPLTLQYTGQLEKKGIPYVFIDSRVEEAHPLAYFGQDSLRSGYLGAKLLLSQKKECCDVAVFSFFHPGQVAANQISLRMEGFNSYIREKEIDCRQHRATLAVNDEKKNELEMKRLFFENPKIEAAIIFSSRSYIVAEFLKNNNLNHIAMIGYDLLEKNVHYLKNNTISYLLAQRPEEQAYKGIKALSDHLIFKKQVSSVHYAPIDILTQENIDFCLGF